MKLKLLFLFSIFMLFCASNSYAQKVTPLSGILNFTDQKIVVEFGDNIESPFRLEIIKVADTAYDVQLSVVHWDISFLTVSTILKGSLRVLTGEDGQMYVVGAVGSKYVLLNNHPFGEMSADILINSKEMIIRSLSLGGFVVSGKVSFSPKKTVNLVVQFSEASLVDIFSIFQKDAMLNVRGDVSGNLRLRGSLEQLKISGILNSYNGSVMGHDYDMAQFNISGVYPLIDITDSYVAQSDGFSFEVNGALDLGNLRNFKAQLRNFISSPLVAKDGQNLEWTLKRMRSDQDGMTTEFKYMLRKGDNDQDDALIGIERKIQF